MPSSLLLPTLLDERFGCELGDNLGEKSNITATEMEHSDSMATEGVQPGRGTLDLGGKRADGH